MLNTCSIGRRWKSREGWSRPVLTGERGTLFPTLAGRVSSCGGFLVGWQGTLFLVVTTMLVRRLSLASVVRFPDRHDRNRSCGWFRFCRPPVFRSAVSYWFCGGHGPGETPGPFPNPEAKAWHGDGTALERVWESSAPPHSHVGGSRRASAPGTPFFCFSSGVRFPWRAGGFLQWVEVFGLWKACGRTGYSSEWVIWDVATRRFVV